MMKKWMKPAAVAAAVLLLAGNVMAGEGGISLYDGFGEEQQSVVFSPQTVSDVQGDVIALDDLDISIMAWDYVKIVQKEGFVYIYTDIADSIPYVIIGSYPTLQDDFVDQFTDYMKTSYPDLQVAENASTFMMNGLSFSKIVYNYSASGYTMMDTRLFCQFNGNTLMFGSKEIPAINYYLPSGYLQQVAATVGYLAGGDDTYDYHCDSTRVVNNQKIPTSELNNYDNGGFGKDDGGNGNGGNDNGGNDNGGNDNGGNDNGGGKVPVGSVLNKKNEYSGYDGIIEFTESAAGYEGKWIEFEDGFKIYIPSNWIEYSLTAEQQNAGALYVAYDPYDSNTPYIEVDWAYCNYTSTDEIVADIVKGGYAVDGTYLINGIPCVVYGSATNDCYGLMFFHPQTQEYLFGIVGSPYSGYDETILAMLCSLSLR